MQLTADAVAMWRTDPHIHGGATQMEPREVTARDKKRYFRFKSNHAITIWLAENGGSSILTYNPGCSGFSAPADRGSGSDCPLAAGN